MPDNVKNIPDMIQAILDKNKGFMSISSLRAKMNRGLQDKLGLKSKDSVNIAAKKLKAALGDRFMFTAIRRKKVTQYVLTPCDPSEFVLASLSPDKPLTPKQLASSLPLTQGEVSAILNELAKEGRILVQFTDKGDAQIYHSGRAAPQPEEYTRGKFREAFDELHKSREFVRICDLRRKLGWPREEFDAMLRELRDSMTIHMAQADESMLTEADIQDCFVDENNYRMGTVTWNVI